MGAKTFTELDSWKLANELKVSVYGLLKRSPADLWLSDQLARAAASATANIAEGFGRYQPKEFAQFLRVANGSLMEVSNHLADGVDRGYFSAQDINPLLTLARRASAALTRLIRYLRTATAPKPPARTQNP
jgi:four helix bundle protein